MHLLIRAERHLPCIFSDEVRETDLMMHNTDIGYHKISIFILNMLKAAQYSNAGDVCRDCVEQGKSLLKV